MSETPKSRFAARADAMAASLSADLQPAPAEGAETPKVIDLSNLPFDDERLQGLAKAAVCKHPSRTGGNDYILCNDCDLMWDYRREQPEAALLREYARAVSSLQQQLAEARKENERLESDLETERLRLAGCGVAAMGNTPRTVAERLQPGHPYYSASYGDVCRIVDSEMALRERAEQAEAALARLQAWQPIEQIGQRQDEVALYFPPEPKRYLGEMKKIDSYPVNYPRKPTHFFALPPAPTDAPAEKEPNR